MHLRYGKVLKIKLNAHTPYTWRPLLATLYSRFRILKSLYIESTDQKLLCSVRFIGIPVIQQAEKN